MELFTVCICKLLYIQLCLIMNEYCSKKVMFTIYEQINKSIDHNLLLDSEGNELTPSWFHMRQFPSLKKGKVAAVYTYRLRMLYCVDFWECLKEDLHGNGQGWGAGFDFQGPIFSCNNKAEHVFQSVVLIRFCTYVCASLVHIFVL